MLVIHIYFCSNFMNLTYQRGGGSRRNISTKTRFTHMGQETLANHTFPDPQAICASLMQMHRSVIMLNGILMQGHI